MKKTERLLKQSLKDCLIQYKIVFLLNKNGNFAEIFQYAYYADTKRLLFTATDRR